MAVTTFKPFPCSICSCISLHWYTPATRGQCDQWKQHSEIWDWFVMIWDFNDTWKLPELINTLLIHTVCRSLRVLLMHWLKAWKDLTLTPPTPTTPPLWFKTWGRGQCHSLLTVELRGQGKIQYFCHNAISVSMPTQLHMGGSWQHTHRRWKHGGGVVITGSTGQLKLQVPVEMWWELHWF